LANAVILEPQDEGDYTVRCLELPGAISQGETKEDALVNIKEAIWLVLGILRLDLIVPSNAEILKVELA